MTMALKGVPNDHRECQQYLPTDNNNTNPSMDISQDAYLRNKPINLCVSVFGRRCKEEVILAVVFKATCGKNWKRQENVSIIQCRRDY